MLKRTYLLSGIAVLTALGLMACGSSGSGQTEAKGSVSGNSGPEAAANEGALNFTMALVDNSQSNYYKGAEKIAELVSEATEGNIQLTIQAGGVLGGEADTLDMAIQGDLDIATCANSVLSNYIPEMSILDQAFLWDSADQANYAVQNELGDLISAEAEKHGLHVIGYLESGFRDVFSKKPIQTPADFKGVKIRVMQNEGQLAAFTAFGANPVAISASEQFTALQQGTIDACENAVSNCWINKYYEAGVNSITNTKHCFVYIPICMSDNAWNKIPEDMREPFVNAVQEGCKAQWTYLNEANAEAVENLEGAGVTFYDIDTEGVKGKVSGGPGKGRCFLRREMDSGCRRSQEGGAVGKEERIRMKFMKKLLSCVTSAEYAVMAAAFIAMVASYFISVLNRNFIQASMPWTEEIAVYSMTYMALLGTEVGLRDGTQVAVTAVVDKLHGVIRKIVDLIRQVILVGFAFIMIKAGGALVLKQLQAGQTTPVMKLPMSLMYFSLVLAFGLIFVIQTITLVQQIAEFGKKEGNRT